MTNLSIKDVPDELAERLRQRAARNHRSLQGELMAIIEQAAGDSKAAPQQLTGPGIGGAGRPVLRRGTKTIEEIAAVHRARFPKPIGAGPSAVDIIRAERDAR